MIGDDLVFIVLKAHGVEFVFTLWIGYILSIIISTKNGEIKIINLWDDKNVGVPAQP